jgi:hypothetical protein
MPQTKYSADQQCQSILDLLAEQNGLGISAIEQTLIDQGMPMARRTLLRRLDRLVEEGAIKATGGSRSTIYLLVNASDTHFGASSSMSGMSGVNKTVEATAKIAAQVAAQVEAKIAARQFKPLAPRGFTASIPYSLTSRQRNAAGQRSVDHVAEPAASMDAASANEIGIQTNAADAVVPLSHDGLEVRDYLRRPIALRKPVGYARSFLEQYKPNQDYYLLPEQRHKLADLGQMTHARLPAGTYARDVFNRLLVDLSWASSRLEGNTYTRLDTQRLIEFGEAAVGKAAHETQMILNHKSAIELLLESADEARLDQFTVLNLHAILSDNLIADPMASGRLRKRAVQITSTVFIPLAMPSQLKECFELLLSKAAAITDPFEQAFFCMVHLPYLQPFEDVNKRVSRLAANIPLLCNGLCPLSFVDVPDRTYIEATLGVYELNRVELLRDVFMWAYERSCQRYLAIRQSVGEPDAFRLRYREVIQQTVRDVVRGNYVGSSADITKIAAGRVVAIDLEPFIEAVSQDINHLYEGNYARYRLKLSELMGWSHRRVQAS